MNSELSVIFKRYFVAALIALAGIIMIIFGISSKQDGLFNMAAVNLFIGGILALLFSAGKLSRSIVFAIGAVCILITLFLGYKSVQSVDATMIHEKDYELSEKLNQNALKDIREIQQAYRSKYGFYAKNFDELEEFFENDMIKKVIAEGAVPSERLTIEERDFLYDDKRAIDQNMTEEEAVRLVRMGNPSNNEKLTHFKRDTVEVSFKEEFFESSTRQSDRKKLNLKTFSFDELRYIPMTDPKEEWTIETRDSVPYMDKDTIPTIFVHGKQGVSRFEQGTRIIVGFGNLKTNSTKGTWE